MSYATPEPLLLPVSHFLFLTDFQGAMSQRLTGVCQQLYLHAIHVAGVPQDAAASPPLLPLCIFLLPAEL